MKEVLVVSPNWLGDVVMALPALRRLRRERPAPETRITILTRPALAPLWRCVEGVDDILELPKTNAATFGAGRALRARDFSEALILPNSFRSALVPWLARIPRRRGTAGHGRYLLVNDRVAFTADERAGHQAFEYAKILCGTAQCDTGDSGFRPPAPPPELAAAAGIAPGARGPLVGIVPGAARGPSKRWPHFAAAAGILRDAVPEARFAVFGGRGEERTCAELASALGAPDLCAKTTLPQFASMLGACDCVLCNDSGGMHLAAAAGTPVVAVFGVTDPAKTGPIGPHVAVVQAQGVRHARAVARDDPAAIRALESISPERVASAALALIRASDRRTSTEEGRK